MTGDDGRRPIASGTRVPDAGALVASLSLEQKVRLLTGADAWSLHAEGTVGLRSMMLSDGPAGVRGAGFDPANPSSSLPCPVALAATWDEPLVTGLTRALGQEARARGVDVLLAPTVNIVRTPLNGRGFECFSEDPLLTARIAVAYVRGLQAAGVAAAVKHYVGNDSETDRHNYDARISDRVLRELYLPPFEACVSEGDVALVMAAYNSVNGSPMTANPRLIHELLKREWGFRGVVVSDDLGSSVQVANIPPGERAERFLSAGGDLIISKTVPTAIEMYGPLLVRVSADERFRSLVDRAVLRVLRAKDAAGLLPCS